MLFFSEFASNGRRLTQASVSGVVSRTHPRHTLAVGIVSPTVKSTCVIHLGLTAGLNVAINRVSVTVSVVKDVLDEKFKIEFECLVSEVYNVSTNKHELLTNYKEMVHMHHMHIELLYW